MSVNKSKVLKLMGTFLVLMLIFTVMAAKVDYAMTNEVQTTSAQPGSLSFQIETQGTAQAGEAFFTLDLTREGYVEEGANVLLSFENISNLVTGIVKEKNFDPESQEVVFTCRIVGGEDLEIYDGQRCGVSFRCVLGDYDLVVPRECVYPAGDGWAVYVVEASQSVLGDYETVRQVGVTVLEEDEFQAALDAPLMAQSQVVRASAKPLADGQKVRSQG